MSKFKDKLNAVKMARSIAANEQNQMDSTPPVIEEPIIEEPQSPEEIVQDQQDVVNEQPIQEEYTQEEQVEEPIVEEVETEEEPNEEFTDEDAAKEQEIEYGEDYKDIHGQITPWHILFKDLGNDIASLDDNGATDYVVNFLYEFNEKYGDDNKYLEVDQSHIDHLKDQLRDDIEINSGMDVLFAIKEKLLETEGLKKKSNTKLRKVKRG